MNLQEFARKWGGGRNQQEYAWEKGVECSVRM